MGRDGLRSEGRLRGRIGVILNPNARKNRKRPGRAADLRRIVGDHGVVRETGSVDELRLVLREMVDEEAAYLVSDGGDGALQWMYNELLALRARERPDLRLPPLLPTNSGTIDFVAKKAGLRGRAEQILERLVARMTTGQAVDEVHLPSLLLEGRRRMPDGTGAPFRRVGFAAAVGGVGQRFFDKYYQVPDPGALSIVRVVATAIASQAACMIPLGWPEHWTAYAREMFAPTPATVTIDGDECPSPLHGAIHAGAFDVNLGGVFRVFPLAKEAGVVHFQAGAIDPWQIVRNIPRLYRGLTIRCDTLWERAGREMTIETTTDELLAPVLDGEIFTGLEAVTVRTGPLVRIATC